ncbi:MAG: MerR family transcriptional regulator [Synergistales bacterium]|nr:MerR family transcriptional regulator [Synergistales bacterium]MDY6400854.1 MerR family transcriptional regulator [Synergistales bacterium]MDY6405438.1 MerR family transcriptional regulator [Synergistales bacterium]MDY6410735.1 MerR family transcriptional regulator [Synergistales bacterium]MDY6414647.1 MerR family transcriptional regulator [Synergistales bacterium]
MPYSIKEMSEITNLPASTLRYYDKQGLLPSLKRDANNVRIFDDEDYRTIKLISCLKKSGLSIKDIKNFMEITAQGDKALNKRLNIFRKRRDTLKKELKDMQEILSVMEYKCWYYEQACAAGTEDAVKNLDEAKIPEKFRKAREHIWSLIPHS